MNRYAIIGFGCAGYHAARSIREHDASADIAIYSDTGLAPYNPMLTTYYVAGKLRYEGMFPFGSLGKIAAELDLSFPGTPATGLDAAARAVTGADGARREFDRILLATGARSVVPPVPGLPAERLFAMRDLEDADRLRRGLNALEPRRALVVGASMVGIKVVELLLKAGVEVTLLDLSERIFPLAAYPDTARAIERRLEARGIDLRFGVSVSEAMEEDDGLRCRLSDGGELCTDLVVMCVGTRAETALAAGQLDTNRGVLVDARMQTSVPGVFAAGDCCEGRNLQTGEPMVLGLWANAGRQGRCAGANMAGGDEVFEGNIIHNITHFLDMDFVGFGDNRVQGEEIVFGAPGDGLYIRAVRGPDGRLAGMNILDSCRISGILKNHMLRLFRGEGGEIPPFQQGMLLREGLDEDFIRRLEGAQ